MYYSADFPSPVSDRRAQFGAFITNFVNQFVYYVYLVITTHVRRCFHDVYDLKMKEYVLYRGGILLVVLYIEHVTQEHESCSVLVFWTLL